MDTPGVSMYVGESMQMTSIRPDRDDDEEDEEERRQREEAIDGMMANAFDDLEEEDEEEESYIASNVTSAGMPPVASNNPPGYGDMQSVYSESAYPEGFVSNYSRDGESQFQHGGHSIRPPDDAEDEADEEERRQREEDIDGMMANAFDDLEEEESFVSSSGLHSAVPNQRQPFHRPLCVPSNGPSDGPQTVYSEEGINGHLENVHHREFHVDENSDLNPSNHVVRDSPDPHDNTSRSQTPWSDVSDAHSNNSFAPHAVRHTDTGRSESVFVSQEMLSDSESHSFHLRTNGLGDSAFANPNPYMPENYQSDLQLKGNEASESDTYRMADGSYEQLKLLYEARGRELDRLTNEINKMKSENLCEARGLHHRINLISSENERQKASLSQCQILLTEREVMVKNMKAEITDLQRKIHELEEENKKMKMELETSESVSSSLQCQLSELKAVDSLARNQQLNENFIKKLRQGNQEERDLLMNKIRDLQTESNTHQDEVKRLVDQLSSLRKNHDDLLVQKAEMTAKLTVTVETLQKQYDDLVQSQGSQRILEFQVKNKTLESDKNQLSEKLRSVVKELESVKEELKGYDSALTFGIFRDAVADGEDSIDQLGLRKALTYDESVAEEHQKADREPMSEKQKVTKLKGELKRSLMANKIKRDEIFHLQRDVQEKQNQLVKLKSELYASQVDLKELRENIYKLKLVEAEREAEAGLRGNCDTESVKCIQVENISLKQELVCLYDTLRNMEETHLSFSSLVNSLKGKKDEKIFDDKDGVITSCNRVLQMAEKYSQVFSGLNHHREVISNLRAESKKQQREACVLEKRLHTMEAKLEASLKMIETALVNKEDKDKESGYAKGVLQKLLCEIKDVLKTLNEGFIVTQERNIHLEDQLKSAQVETERQKYQLQCLGKEKEDLKAEYALQSEKKDKEKVAAVQSCQDSYLKFHEDAVKELHLKFNEEYENIGAKLKSEISRLAEELSNVKDLYVCVCKEKNELEELLKKQNVEGYKGDSTANFNKETQLFKKKVQMFEEELANLQSKHAEEKAKHVTEKEELEKCYKLKCEEFNELSKKLDTVLENKHSVLEDKAVNTMDENLSEESLAKGHEKCMEMLKAKRLEMKSMEEELSDLKGKLTQVEALGAKGHKEALEKSKEEVKSLREKLQNTEKCLKVQEEKGEEEVRQLTDMLMNHENKLREKEEEILNAKSAFQRVIQNLESDREVVEKKLKAEINTLSSKYKNLKRQFKEYHEACEVKRKRQDELNKENREEIDTWKEKVKQNSSDCLEKIKKTFKEALNDTIGYLKAHESKVEALLPIRKRLEGLCNDLMNISILFTSC